MTSLSNIWRKRFNTNFRFALYAKKLEQEATAPEQRAKIRVGRRIQLLTARDDLHNALRLERRETTR